MLVDFKYSLIRVQGAFIRLNVGFNIGSNLAAGGATLFASHMESQIMRIQTYHTRREFYEKVVALRWMDDLWLLIKGTPSEGVLNILWALTRDGMYPGLRLLRTKDTDAFGYVVSIMRHGTQCVKTQQKQKIQMIGAPHRVDAQASIIGGPGQFLSDRQKRGILSGYFIRILDMSVCPAEEVLAQFRRLLVALSRAGYSNTDLQRSLRNVNQVANLDLSPALDILPFPLDSQYVWAHAFDLTKIHLANCEELARAEMSLSRTALHLY
jgi:hypothetical protein